MDSVTITVAAVNDAPINNVPGPQTASEDTACRVSHRSRGDAISVSDVDAGANPIEVTLTATNGTLSLSGAAGLTFTSGTGSGDAEHDLSGTAAAVNAALDGLVYLPAASFNGAASLTIASNDLGGADLGRAQTDSSTIAITVAAVNDAPTNQMPSSQVTDENALLTLSTAGGNPITISDIDAGAGTVQITLAATGGTVSLASTAGLTLVTGTGSGNALLTVRGTLADINAALDGMTFRPTLNFNGLATIAVTTDDLGDTARGARWWPPPRSTSTSCRSTSRR